MSSTMTERHIAALYDKKGEPFWQSVLSPPDDSVGVCSMIPDRIIPVIFVPGVMGSNLKGIGTNKDVQWRLDSAGTMSPWMIRGAAYRKTRLNPGAMTVDDGGVIPPGTEQDVEELKRRGWGEVGNMSYGGFLVWLENALSDFDQAKHGLRHQLIGQVLGAANSDSALTTEQVGLSYRYRFPVHACGYNWLDSNAKAAQRLQTRIQEIQRSYKKSGKKCDKVIIVTHSMGGLVARHCSEVLGMRAQIFGVVHGVMPAIGAAAVYRRMKSGTENPGGGVGDWFMNHLTNKALGENAAEMTAVLSSAPGPLQLLPTPEYGNGWLVINNGKTSYRLPKSGDPYSEIYTVRGEWWSLCEDHLVNPLNGELDPQRKQQQRDRDWDQFSMMVDRDIEGFHTAIDGKYHPNSFAFYGSDQSKPAYGNVTWTGRDVLGARMLTSSSRPSYPMGGHALDASEIGEQRTIASPLGGDGWQTGVQQTYRISNADENGDGTVPHRSGVAPQRHVKSLLRVDVGHEPAYKDSDVARQFTLRAIVQIAQAVQSTALAYD